MLVMANITRCTGQVDNCFVCLMNYPEVSGIRVAVPLVMNCTCHQVADPLISHPVPQILDL